MQQTIVFFFVFCRVVRYLGFEMSAIVGVVCHPSPHPADSVVGFCR
jgi:hypothetical protein